MLKEIKKIVLTGGPCAGKSTAMTEMEAALDQIGYKVIIVPEVATEFINCGVKPDNIEISGYDFQFMLLKYQLEREKLYEEIASKMSCEKIVLICDRGALDGKAYCSAEDFKLILQKLDTNEIKLRDEYDAIFHLKTAAIGAEEFYTTSNNKARKETIEEAIILDGKTVNAWIGHPKLRIFDNSTDFNTKINRVVGELFNILGKPVPIEFSRKFLVQIPNLQKVIEEFYAEKINIVQTYLKMDKEDEEKRIRQRGTNGNYIYTLTTTKVVNHISRIKTERRIPPKEYLSLLIDADPQLRQIIKERYCFVHKNSYYELDIYPFWNDKAILEIKLTKESQEIEIPEFIEVLKEVTDDKSYLNSSLAKQIPN